MPVDRQRRLRLDVLLRRRVVHELVDRQGLLQRARPVDRGVARDPVEERDERKPAILVPIDRMQSLHEDVRREVFGVVRGTRAREAIAVDRVAVTLVELPERRGISGLGGANKRSIGSGLTSCQVDRARPAYCHVGVALLHLTKARGNPFTCVTEGTLGVPSGGRKAPEWAISGPLQGAVWS